MRKYTYLLLLLLWLPLTLCASANAGSYSADKFYTIAMKSNRSSYISEESDGTLVVTSYDVTKRIFWQFIPTSKTNCYYIRNSASGNYIASCNVAQSRASIMKTSSTPVEYYIGTNGNFCRLTSTDCTNYDNTGASPNGLNKDGASSNVIVWKAGASNGNSWWSTTETENLYELRPFVPSTAVGKPARKYLLKNTHGLYLTMTADGSLSWGKNMENSAQWYFVGTGNSTGGYQLVNVAADRALGANAHYKVCAGKPAGYYFTSVATPQTTLTIDGDSLVTFVGARSEFARREQIYDFPCGALTSNYVLSASLKGAGVLTPLTYPAQVASGRQIIAPNTKPNTWYTIYTASKATLVKGRTATLALALKDAPQAGDSVYVYFDWNRDGVFEIAQKLTAAKEMEANILIPANAATGKSRMRIRFTSNGLTEADEEVTGQTLDFILEVMPEEGQTFTASVTTNDSQRGTATLDGFTAKATPLGNARFLCWKENNNVVSLDATYTFALDHNVALTAYFSPNTSISTGIIAATTQKSLITITAQNQCVTVEPAQGVKTISIYSTTGQLAAQGKGHTLNISHLPAGSYIVLVDATQDKASSKIVVK